MVLAVTLSMERRYPLYAAAFPIYGQGGCPYIGKALAHIWARLLPIYGLGGCLYIGKRLSIYGLEGCLYMGKWVAHIWATALLRNGKFSPKVGIFQ